MPVRKIPKNHISVTGRHATSKGLGDVEFESRVENDYLIVLDFDSQVDRYEVQPVRVPVPGSAMGYVPDVLVHFCPHSDGTPRPSELTEVKLLEDLEKNAAKYAPKFSAAQTFARERGWTFVIKTERDIRTPRLGNFKFIRAYRRLDPPADGVTLLLDCLAAQGGRSTSTQLLEALASTDASRAALLPTLWHLVATHRVAVDWDTPFGAQVPLWLPGAPP